MDYDAPQYMSFERVKLNGYEDSPADEWFDRHGSSPSLTLGPESASSEQHGFMPMNKDNKEEEGQSVLKTQTSKDIEPGLTACQSRKLAFENAFADVCAVCDVKKLPKRPQNKRPCALKASVKIHQQLSSRKPMKALRSESGQLAMPKTPEVVRRYKLKEEASKPQKTAEERELETIQKMQQEAKQRLILSQKSLKRTRAAARTNSQATINPVKSDKPLTEAVGFHFRTEERLKKRSGCRPRGLSPSTSAEFISKFPYSLREDSSVTKDLKSKPSPPRKPTIPRTPQLQSRQRSRPVKVLGFKEQEEKEIEEMQSYKFKAKPLNQEIFNKSGLYGLKQRSSCDPPTVTVPHSPLLTTKQRGCRKRRNTVEEEIEQEPFKANPVPEKMFEKVLGMPEKKCAPITMPVTPAFLRSSKKRRIDQEESNEESSQEDVVLKAQPMPEFKNVFKPKLSHKRSDMQPFSFEGRYRSKDEVVEELVLQDEKTAAEQRKFTATLMPDLQQSPVLPPKQPVLKTQLVPFHLKTEERGDKHAEMFSIKVNEELQTAKTLTQFKASEAKAIYTKPFVPTRSQKPLTETKNIPTHTDCRLEQRAKFDFHIKKVQEMKELAEIQRQTMAEQEKEKEIKKLRRSQVHKAQPVRHYPMIEIHPSMKKPTAPSTPILATETRLRNRSQTQKL